MLLSAPLLSPIQTAPCCTVATRTASTKLSAGVLHPIPPPPPLTPLSSAFTFSHIEGRQMADDHPLSHQRKVIRYPEHNRS